jgi:hypothetical protein
MLRREFLVKGTAVGIAAPFVSTKLAWGQSGSLERINIVSTSGTLMLYLMCCLGLLRLRAGNVATAGAPFRAPGGSWVPLAASGITPAGGCGGHLAIMAAWRYSRHE